jgi:hypothetical protein
MRILNIISLLVIFNLALGSIPNYSPQAAQARTARQKRNRRLQKLIGEWRVVDGAATKFILNIRSVSVSATANSRATFNYDLLSPTNIILAQNQIGLIKKRTLTFNNTNRGNNDTYVINLNKRLKKGNGSAIYNEIADCSDQGFGSYTCTQISLSTVDSYLRNVDMFKKKN